MTTYYPATDRAAKAVLQAAERPLTVTEIAERAGRGISASSVSTVMIRHFDLGHVTRKLQADGEMGTVLAYTLVQEVGA